MCKEGSTSVDKRRPSCDHGVGGAKATERSDNLCSFVKRVDYSRF